MKRLVFWNYGDSSVGIPGDEAVVEFDGSYDDEFLLAAEEILLPAFAELFDDVKTYCRVERDE